MIPEECTVCIGIKLVEHQLRPNVWILRCPRCSRVYPYPLIHHYQIIKKLGEGGMGKVFLAEDTILGRKVAVKSISPRLAGNPQAKKRFLREARAAGTLQHENICVIYAIAKEEDHIFIIMEHIEGETLHEKIRQARNRPTDLLEWITIAFQVIDGLAKAHSKGIIHRDIKPQNVMISPNGDATIMDFGLAKIIQPIPPLPEYSDDLENQITLETPLTDFGKRLGTYAYMSPEQTERDELDHRSDIFSFGVTFYEMLTGRNPFIAANHFLTMYKIQAEAPEPINKYWPNAPADLQLILDKTLNKRREDRYQKTEDLREDLQKLRHRLVFNDQVDAKDVYNQGPDPVRNRQRYFSSTKKRFLWSTLVVSLFLVVILAVILSFVRKKPDDIRPIYIAVLPLASEDPDPNIEALNNGVIESITNKLSQLSDLHVLAKSAPRIDKSQDVDPLETGRKLKADFVLAVTIKNHEDNLSINSQLLRISDDAQVWGDLYKAKAIEIIKAQEEIPVQIVGNVYLALTGKPHQKVKSRQSGNPLALQMYLRGRYHWNKRTAGGIKKAIDYFSKAIEYDAQYALAYAGIADCYNLMSIYSDVAPGDSFPKAEAAAEKAISLDDQLAEAHASLAFALYRYHWNFTKADKEFKRALELDPDYATAHHWYGEYLLPMGKPDDAIAEMKKAYELDPNSLIINSDLAATYLMAGRPEDAIKQVQQASELDEHFVYASGILGQSYEHLGQLKQARKQYEKILEATGDRIKNLPPLARIWALQGDTKKAEAALNELLEVRKHHYVSPYDIALIYINLDKKDEALQFLNLACEQRCDRLIWIKIDPLLEDIRSDRRFANLVECVFSRAAL